MIQESLPQLEPVDLHEYVIRLAASLFSSHPMYGLLLILTLEGSQAMRTNGHIDACNTRDSSAKASTKAFKVRTRSPLN